jgi:hypothetical protein
MQSNIHHRDTETRRREKEKSEITEETEGTEPNASGLAYAAGQMEALYAK